MDYGFKKNIIRCYLKLEKNTKAKELISLHLSGFDKKNEYGNSLRVEFPLEAYNSYFESLEFVEHLSQEQKALINLNRVLFDSAEVFLPKMKLKVMEMSHTFLKKNWEELKKIRNTNFLSEFLLKNEIIYCDPQLLKDKLENLIKLEYIQLKILKSLNLDTFDSNRKLILEQFLEEKLPPTKDMKK